VKWLAKQGDKNFWKRFERIVDRRIQRLQAPHQRPQPGIGAHQEILPIAQHDRHAEHALDHGHLEPGHVPG
jgi:hypothetical protein